MSQIKTNYFEGDVTTGRHIKAGGDITAAGNATVKKNLRVEGWLDAPNIKGPCKGMYSNLGALRNEYPEPEAGWYALLGDKFPAQLCVVHRGEWEATDKYVDGLNVDVEVFNKLVAVFGSVLEDGDDISNYFGALQSDIDIQTRRIDTLVGNNASEAIDNFNEVLSFLQGVTDKETLTGLLNDIRNTLKQVQGAAQNADSTANSASRQAETATSVAQAARDTANNALTKVAGHDALTVFPAVPLHVGAYSIFMKSELTGRDIVRSGLIGRLGDNSTGIEVTGVDGTRRTLDYAAVGLLFQDTVIRRYETQVSGKDRYDWVFECIATVEGTPYNAMCNFITGRDRSQQGAGTNGMWEVLIPRIRLLSVAGAGTGLKPEGGTGDVERTVQADWNAREGEPGYIANRPFAGDDPLICDFTGDIRVSAGSGAYSIGLKRALVDGHRYLVELNDTAIECYCSVEGGRCELRPIDDGITTFGGDAEWTGFRAYTEVSGTSLYVYDCPTDFPYNFNLTKFRVTEQAENDKIPLSAIAGLSEFVGAQTQGLYPIAVTTEIRKDKTSGLVVYGHEALAAKGYVPYVFRYIVSSNRRYSKKNNVYLSRVIKKGWCVYGICNRGQSNARVTEGGIVEFGILKTDEAKEVVFSNRPEALLEFGYNQEVVKVIKHGARSILLEEDTARHIEIRYALAFGPTFNNTTKKITPADMVTPLAEFSVVYDRPLLNSGAIGDENLSFSISTK